MLPSILPQKDLFALVRIIQESRHVVVCAHRGPDGDALGSSLALAEYLQQLGKSVSIVLPTPFPDFLRWMPGTHAVQFYVHHERQATQVILSADTIFCLDFSQPSRLQEMQGAFMRSRATRVVIDHHLAPDLSMARLVVSCPEMSSTCELLFRVLLDLGAFETLSRNAAVCLYTGMMTDTGGFTYNSSRPEIYEIISMLLTKGIDKDRIYRNVFHVYSTDRLRLTGYVLYEKLQFLAGGKAAYFTLTREEMQRFRFIRGDAEGLVNMPLQVKGLRLSISLREDTERDVVRVSLRSVDDFPCNRMAEEFFNGGGHLNASGGELPFPLSEAVRTVERAVEAYESLMQ
ncbi:MAG: DHH family phosphoesterase [Alloprevotella sp.]|nr:DHH family phosphoesterase [Alloprevotella sp.]